MGVFVFIFLFVAGYNLPRQRTQEGFAFNVTPSLKTKAAAKINIVFQRSISREIRLSNNDYNYQFASERKCRTNLSANSLT